MAIGISTIKLLMRESKRRRFNGSILQLGRQEIWTDDNGLAQIADKESYALATVEGAYDLKKSKFVDCMCMQDSKFFKMLGFSSVHSTDISDFEGADFIHDMNLPISNLSPHFNKYNLILNGGTLEHIFHIPNALKNISDLLAVNGRVIHCAPMDQFNHGFYNFSPCFFEDYYRANGFEIGEFLIVRRNYKEHANGTYYCTQYNSQLISSLVEGAFDKAEHSFYFVATKLSSSTCDVIPLQGYYKNIFNKNEAPSSIESVPNVRVEPNDGWEVKLAKNVMFKSVYGILKKVPVISSLLKYARDLFFECRSYKFFPKDSDARPLVKWEPL